MGRATAPAERARALSSADVSAIQRSGSLLTLSPRDRHLPFVEAQGYVVGDAEPLAVALHRLTTEQFTVAIDALGDPSADVGLATTAAVRAMARVAAVLRLVRSSIGDEAYRTELAILGETTSLLETLLAGQPELRALDAIRARYVPVLHDDAFAGLRHQLHQRHRLRRLQALSEGEALQQALHRLRRARARFAAWPIDSRTDAQMYGREPVADAFDSLAAGLGRTYRRGRGHWKAVETGDRSALPKLQREVRHLGHQLAIVSSSWPEVLGAAAETCGRLEAVLVEDAAMSALHDALHDTESLTVDPTEAAMLEALVAGTRAELHGVIGTIGTRVYVEPPKAFLARLAAYWRARGLDADL